MNDAYTRWRSSNTPNLLKARRNPIANSTGATWNPYETNDWMMDNFLNQGAPTGFDFTSSVNTPKVGPTLENAANLADAVGTAADVADGVEAAKGIKGWYGKHKGKFFKEGGAFSEGGKFGGMFNTLTNPQFDLNDQYQLQGWGKNIGKWSTIGNGIYQGINAAQGLGDLADARDAGQDLVSDIVTASYDNPMLSYDLSSEQMDLLRQLRRGTYDDSVGIEDVDLAGTLGGALKGGLTGFLTGGGIPGAIVGAVGGGANAVIDDLGQARNINNAELEALLQALESSRQQQNAMKKQRMYAALGGY